MQGHMALHKYVLHHHRNSLVESYLEAIGVYVSSLNDCEYCFDHHFSGMERFIAEAERAAVIRQALLDRQPELAFQGAELAVLQYAGKLSLTADIIRVSDINALRAAGLDDGEILEINQVTHTLPMRIEWCSASASILR